MAGAWTCLSSLFLFTHSHSQHPILHRCLHLINLRVLRQPEPPYELVAALLHPVPLVVLILLLLDGVVQGVVVDEINVVVGVDGEVNEEPSHPKDKNQLTETLNQYPFRVALLVNLIIYIARINVKCNKTTGI
ncbi:hypothetical protein EV1_007640 [Malus domestica]